MQGFSWTFSFNRIILITKPEGEARSELMEMLFKEFEMYLIHGGFLTAINDMAGKKRILGATLSTYSDWIRGDVLKRGKQEHYLREILTAIVKHYGSRVTWNNLAGELSIDHPKTVVDYVALLQSMDAVYVQAALREDKLTGAPKKPRKLMFTDPFIFHAVRGWLKKSDDPYQSQIQTIVKSTEWASLLVESCAVTHFRRRFPTYYIKAKGEVDIAIVDGNKFRPIEVKWSGQLRPKDVMQIGKYPDGRILDKSKRSRKIDGIPAEPLPLALFRLDAAESSVMSR